MPVEILTASLRTEWERFREEIDDASLTGVPLRNVAPTDKVGSSGRPWLA
jgi:hypothetical protein